MNGGVLSGMRIIEGSAFVAAPLGGMTLAQMGADVIRFDQIGGGLDHRRWPVADNGASLFWAGMNKGKRSIQLDLHAPAGRELVRQLVSAPGEDGGIFLTNFPARGWLGYDHLSDSRRDLIMVALTGNADGSSEVDYTVHPATGFPYVTGPIEHGDPVNSVLPAWDIALGSLAATGLLAAERYRRRTGQGQLISASLSDVAFAMVGNLGRIGQAALLPPDGGVTKEGNYLYGAFGRSFATRDHRQVMVVGLTERQWTSLCDAMDLWASCSEIQTATGEDLSTESGRYRTRQLLAAAIEPWVAARSYDEVSDALNQHNVIWGPYQSFSQLLDDPRVVSPLSPFSTAEHPGVGEYPMPASPLSFSVAGRLPVARAPELGEHTDEILADVLELSAAEIGKLHDNGLVA
ncbi:2-methylfumaryl-CoA isomerase [Rhodococcus sp. 15-725-2-2b]|uniref:CoA transferase n=1 Tax=unclassified Rhodococcus (in: high G+C Gram-positive bacteria) TaxID=192944 RepID=UPI000B9BFA1A|nr:MULTISPECIES: CoA transferase [unclassified Rhodococcus (in: high G+C Gram-positive bacteria)]OZC63593.1 2-methylfumaryl-CoA isomerase [Rhodococcus sp. 06-469-3-2]OZD40758.1 2-methylfumaryl-CoA isomerase [Rhodococcus sp. 06-1477-1A]OZE67134.1 2-methylfumaryl-CoA isomerase [Rhodococcus sp. 15-725-2-2b]